MPPKKQFVFGKTGMQQRHKQSIKRKHREILNDMKKNYVELNAYKESQTHIYSELEKVSTGIEDLKNYLMGKGTNHDR